MSTKNECVVGHKSSYRHGDRCVVCDRPLKTESARRVGAGPKCTKRAGGKDAIEKIYAERDGQMDMFKDLPKECS